ncbi:pectin acetylesterase 11-like [Ipomoea triloba]|uniref:pectin acetylesterase 11-like n=1 Tax=Ipomoea triloba TaxID=35885 RepID=UPI00125D011A|nr:pectin acetylesterase 11-like [Ipomoea triloba]
MATTTFLLLLGFIVILTTPLQAQTPDDIVPISWVQNVIVKGAVCLDGTPSAYYYEQGQGDGANNWLVFLQGGGWCVNQTDCFNRATYGKSSGSTKNISLTFTFRDFLSNNPTNNPDFYNWNRVYVPYCDGSSFTGDVEAPDSRCSNF